MKKIKNLQSLFKKYIVKRPNGMCQVLFSLTELDNLCDDIQLFYNEKFGLKIEAENYEGANLCIKGR